MSAGVFDVAEALGYAATLKRIVVALRRWSALLDEATRLARRAVSRAIEINSTLATGLNPVRARMVRRRIAAPASTNSISKVMPPRFPLGWYLFALPDDRITA